MKKIALVALPLLSGCAVSTTYVSSIGMRQEYAVIAQNAGERQIEIRETRMEPVGGPCFSFMPYQSLTPGSKSKLVSHYRDEGQPLPPSRQYRKWYGYPAQGLQLVAVPADIVLNIGIGVSALVAYPFVLLADAGPKKN